MRIYETTFILSPHADDITFDRQIKSITDLITRFNGKILHEDRWGIRRLAYPIQKFTQGFFTRLVFECGNDALTELDRLYRLEEAYIRFLTVQFEGSLEDLKKSEITGEKSEHSDDFRRSGPASSAGDAGRQKSFDERLDKDQYYSRKYSDEPDPGIDKLPDNNKEL